MTAPTKMGLGDKKADPVPETNGKGNGNGNGKAKKRDFPPLLTFDLRRQRTSTLGILGVLIVAAVMGAFGHLEAALVGLLSTAIMAIEKVATMAPKESDVDEEQTEGIEANRATGEKNAEQIETLVGAVAHLTETVTTLAASLATANARD